MSVPNQFISNYHSLLLAGSLSTQIRWILSQSKIFCKVFPKNPSYDLVPPYCSFCHRRGSLLGGMDKKIQAKVISEIARFNIVFHIIDFEDLWYIWLLNSWLCIFLVGCLTHQLFDGWLLYKRPKIDFLARRAPSDFHP